MWERLQPRRGIWQSRLKPFPQQVSMPPIVIALPHRCHETVADGGQHPRAVGGCGMPDMATMLETALQQRYPQWFAGRRGHWLRPLVRGFGRWSGLALLTLCDRPQELQELAAHAEVRALYLPVFDNLATLTRALDTEAALAIAGD